MWAGALVYGERNCTLGWKWGKPMGVKFWSHKQGHYYSLGVIFSTQKALVFFMNWKRGRMEFYYFPEKAFQKSAAPLRILCENFSVGSKGPDSVPVEGWGMKSVGLLMGWVTHGTETALVSGGCGHQWQQPWDSSRNNSGSHLNKWKIVLHFYNFCPSDVCI